MITGATGQVGSDVTALLTAAGVAPTVPAGDRAQSGGELLLACDHAALDIADSAAVESVIANFAPDVVINAAGYTAVDAAEADEAAAYAANAVAPALLAAALARHGGRLIHLSTDYVFRGDGTIPYEVDDATDPRTAYGRTKRAGELAVRQLLPDASFVVRTSWVFGAGGQNFVKTMLRLQAERDTVRVVNDQIGSPTYSLDLAAGLIELARSPAGAGIYHCTNAGQTSWYEFARAIFAASGADPSRVEPVGSAAFPRLAPRPSYSVLSNSAWRAASLTPLGPWRAALESMLAARDRRRLS